MLLGGLLFPLKPFGPSGGFFSGLTGFWVRQDTRGMLTGEGRRRKAAVGELARLPVFLWGLDEDYTIDQEPPL